MTLDEILMETERESLQRQAKYPLAMLEREVKRMKPTRGFARAIRRQQFGVIAEVKRKSPSMGSINEAAIDAACSVYHSHPAVVAISVLTQHSHFGGSTEDLVRVRKETQKRPKPILRKDFIRTRYEVVFSRWLGADAILLMANVVTDKSEFKALHDLALDIGLDVLCEIHDKNEIELLPDNVKLCGINSRRFKGVNQRKPLSRKLKEAWSLVSGASIPNHDTQTDLETFSLFSELGHLPPDCLRVAESGVSAENVGRVLAKYPFNAALIGTSLLKAGRNSIGTELTKIQKAACDALSQRNSDSNVVAEPALA